MRLVNTHLAIGILFATLITIQGQSTKPQIETVSVCQLARNPHKYDGQTLRLRAVLVENHIPRVDGGDPSFYDPQCLATPFSVVAEWDDAYQVGGSAGVALERLRGNRDKYGDSQAEVTVVGRFDGPKGVGYGHLDWARSRFVISSLESAKPVAGNLGRPDRSDSNDPIVDEEENVRGIDGYVGVYFGGGTNGREEVINAMADDYLLTEYPKVVKNKRQVLAESVAPARGSIGVKVISLRVYDRTAVTAGRVETCEKVGECLNVSYTNVYVKRGGAWKLVASHLTRVGKED